MVTLVDDAPEVGARARVRSEELLGDAGERRDEFLFPLALDEHVVRGDADLSGVEVLAPGDASRGRVEIHIVIHDARALAAQFQRDGRELLRGRLGDDAPHRSATGIEDVVPPLCEQRGRLPGASLDDRHGIRVEVVGNRFCHQGRTTRAQFRRLEHGAIPGGHGADQRHDEQLHRAVPGTDDQHDPTRIPNDALPARNRTQPHGFGLHPALEIVERIGGLVGADAQLHAALEFRPRYVCPHGRDEFIATPFQHLADRLQLAAAPVQRSRTATVEGTAQTLDGSRRGGGLVHACSSPGVSSGWAARISSATTASVLNVTPSCCPMCATRRSSVGLRHPLPVY